VLQGTKDSGTLNSIEFAQSGLERLHPMVSGLRNSLARSIRVQSMFAACRGIAKRGGAAMGRCSRESGPGDSGMSTRRPSSLGKHCEISGFLELTAVNFGCRNRPAAGQIWPLRSH
jgi:hypothetical protein